MNFVDLIALTLAIGGLVDCWLNGKIFAGARRRLASSTLASCDYCLNWNVPIWLVLGLYLPSLFLRDPWKTAAKLPIYWLAAAYASWLINELRAGREKDFNRTKRAEEDMEKYGGDATPGEAEPTAEYHAEKLPPGHILALAIDEISDTDPDHREPFCSESCRKSRIAQLKSAFLDFGVSVQPFPAGSPCSACGGAVPGLGEPRREAASPSEIPCRAIQVGDDEAQYFCSEACAAARSGVLTSLNASHSVTTSAVMRGAVCDYCHKPIA